ncbi:MAG: oxidoreductase, partial [Planctomycetota bacterium]
LLLFLTGSPVAQVHATALRPAARHTMKDENFTATINFEDGTLATLTYTALGGRACPKERLEVFCDGRVLVVDDYRELVIFDDRGARQALRATDKGHRALLLAFAGAARSGGEWPIPLVEQVRATRIALEVEKRIRSGSQVVD